MPDFSTQSEDPRAGFRRHTGKESTPAHQHPLTRVLEDRIAIIDGAMGTTIRTYGMKEADIRGERFKNSKKDLLNNGDCFPDPAGNDLRHPSPVFGGRGGHRRDQHLWRHQHHPERVFCRRSEERGGRKDPAFYQKIIEDAFLGNLAWEINQTSARQCREWADRVANSTSRPGLWRGPSAR